MGVFPIGDKTEFCADRRASLSHNARRAGGKLAHCVIEMGDGARTGVEYALGVLRARVPMA